MSAYEITLAIICGAVSAFIIALAPVLPDLVKALGRLVYMKLTGKTKEKH